MSQHAAFVAFACVLCLVLALPTESSAEPCDENKKPQQSAEVKEKKEVSKPVAAKAKSDGSVVPKSKKAKAVQVEQVKAKTKKPDNSARTIAEPVKVESKLEKVASSTVKQLKPEKVAVKPEVAEINMKVLTKRLKETDAIGLFTKLAIRNDVTDLMDEVKRYRKKSMLATKMKEIRESFEGLLLKIVALLEEDPELSRDLYVGRESIWKSLLEVKV